MENIYTFAILVDAENVPYKKYQNILNEVEKYGSVAIKWVYADWTNHHHKKWQDVLHDTASRPKHQFNHGKDSADHALIMDAIELTSDNSRINAVCIVSSDGGYYSLAQRIREYGLHVMAIGNEKTPLRFIKACHNFVFLDNLNQEQQSSIQISNSLQDLLLQAYLRIADTQEPVYMGDMGSMLKKLQPSFDSRTHGYNSLKKLIKAQNMLFDIVGESSDQCFISLKQGECKQGKVRLWDSNKHFGFIHTPYGDYHFRPDDLADGTNINSVKKGAVVAFSSAFDGNKLDNGNCPPAKEVALISH